MTLDGCEHVQPRYGGDFNDIASWLWIAGAVRAVNLDGGGSTVMARRDLDSRTPIVMNVQYGDEVHAMQPRKVGSYLGVVPGKLG